MNRGVDNGLPWQCPTCGAAARIEPGVSGPTLRCDAGHRFASVDGVLCLCDTQNYADSFGREWLEHSRTQIDRWNGTTISRDRFFDYTAWPQRLEGETILEAGSGAGRFTQVLLDAGARVVSFDYSGAVLANAQNNAGARNLTLYRGDIYQIPFAPRSFDRVVCIGVLQHTPDPERAFRSLVRMLKPGGQLAVDIYRLGAVSVLHPKYFLRPLRWMLPPAQVFPVVRRLVPPLLAVKKAVRRMPLVGVPLAHAFVPVSDYRGRLPLTDDQARAWAELEMVDMITPAHDRPATRRQVERWCRDAALRDVTIEVVSKGWQFVIRGCAPARIAD